jgi:putative hydrolase of the HAD superfamily
MMDREPWIEDLQVVAFDADDTLWDCQTHFDRVTELMCHVLRPWASHDEAWQALLDTERGNLPITGYGCKAYILSVVETALRVSHNEIPAADIDRLLKAGNQLLLMPATPLPEVEQTLHSLRLRIDDERRPLRLVVFTKGELMDQQNKLERSGLAPLFDYVEITSDKRAEDFQQLCWKLLVRPDQLLMVGNSFKSDIAPALSIGSFGLHIPFHVQWEMEHAEVFDHPHCRRITNFSEVLNYVFPH